MRRENGFVLPLVLSLVAVIVLLIFTGTITSISDLRNTRSDKASFQAEYLARAGFNQYKTIAFQSFQQYLANQNAYATEAAKYAQCGNLLAIGLDIDRDGSPDIVDDPLRPGLDEKEEILDIDGVQGKYRIYYKVVGANIILRSVGEIDRSRAVIQGVIQGQNAGGLSNAIFAGRGQSGQHINGGVDVYGSVYVEGNNPATTVIDTNGGFQMHNKYSSGELQTITSVPSARMAEWLKLQALQQEDMCTHLRIKTGKLKISGRTELGDETSETEYGDELLAGVKVGGGSSDITIEGNGKIHSATTPGAFDLSPGPRFPILDAADDVNYEALPANVKAALPATASWKDTMKKDAELNGMIVSSIGVQPTASGCSISTILSAGKLSFGSQNVTCFTGSPQRGLKYTYNSTLDQGVLEIKGMLNLRGIDLEFKKNLVVRYDGKATMFVEKIGSTGGNVSVAGDVLPSNSFPDRDVLGVIAEGNVDITGEQQALDAGSLTRTQVVMGIFYAKNTVSVNKKAVMFGTIMGTRVDLSTGSGGGGKSKVVQVPGLEYNLPPGFASLKTTINPTFTLYSYERK